jgi:hypothetical protein
MVTVSFEFLVVLISYPVQQLDHFKKYCFIISLFFLGVQEAFFYTPSVFTLSFHKYAAGFFPGSITISLTIKCII